MKSIPAFLFFISFLLAKTITAQPDIKFESITSKDGLSGNIVYSLLQDNKGFLWIGTHRGLNRYDGYKFNHYLHDPSDSNSISSNHVHCIREDGRGRLWLSTLNGLNCLDPSTNTFKKYFPAEKNLSKDLRDLLLVNDSTMLIVSPSGIYKFNPLAGSFQLIKVPFTFSYFDSWIKFSKNKNGDVFIPYPNHKVIIRINYEKNVGELMELPNLSQLPGGCGLQSVFFTQDETIMFAGVCKNQLLVNSLGKSSGIKSFPIPVDISLNTEFFYEDPSHFIWLYYARGLVLVDHTNNKIRHYRHDPKNPFSLSNEGVTSIICDKKGVYWLGTFGSGLCRFQFNNQKFSHIVAPPVESSNNAMITGLTRLSFNKILGGIDNKRCFFLNPDMSINFLKDDDLSLQNSFFGLTGMTLEKISRKERDFVIRHAPWFHQAYGAGLIKDQNNRIWFTSLDSVYNSDTIVKMGMINPVVTPENNFLFANQQGVYEFDTRNYKLHDLSSSLKPGAFRLTGKICVNIVRTGPGDYWVATHEDGLVHLNTIRNESKQYTIRDGLPNNTLYMILPDKKGRLWISTNNGLSCFDTISQTFTNFSVADGLINSEYNTGSACSDERGNFYFGGMTGIDYFNPDSIGEAKNLPLIHLSAFRVFDNQRQLKPVYYLATDENSFAIQFTSNDFLAAAQMFYRYKLTGVDLDWVTVQGINQASYNKLPPDHYTFIVQASYDKKKWSNPLSVDIHIATPWHRSWWFYVLIAAAVFTGIYIIFRYRLRHQMKLFLVRQRLHRDLHDDVGATLSSVKIYSEILKDNPNNPFIAELIKENSEEMIEKLDVIAWATDPQHDNFKSLKTRIQKFAIPLCRSKNIEYSFENDDIREELIIPGEVRQNLLLIFKEAITNMIKYAEATTCATHFFTRSGQFILQIADNGNGGDGTIKGNGNGWKNMQKRASDIGSELLIESSPGWGTIITLRIPYPFKIPSSWDKKQVSY